MAATDEVAIVRLGASDARAGLLLSTEAHWNQNEADWRFFLTKGDVFGVRDNDGLLIASAALLPYSAGNAWISMVLVTEKWRRRGLATRLVDACLAAAAKQGLPPGSMRRRRAPPSMVRSDLRRRCSLGGCGSSTRCRPRLKRRRRYRLARSTISSRRTVWPWVSIAALLLGELGGRSGSRLLSDGEAFALVRDGRKARHIGPLFAESAEQAHALVNEIVWTESGPLLIDAVYEQEEFLKRLTGSGWKIERPFQRMRFGAAAALPGRLPFAVAGPEYG